MVNNKISILQLFRGLAALLVLFHHATNSFHSNFNSLFFNGFFLNGSVGVDFFFVLSGFIIYYIHYKDIGESHKFKLYASKRIIRVFPVYWLISLLILPVYFISKGNFGTGHETEIQVIIKSFLLIPQEPLPILPVGWTLSYEMLFYSVFALLILLKPKVSYPIVITWTLLTVITLISDIKFDFLFSFVFSLYNLEFLFGCISAYVFLKYNPQRKLSLILIGTIGFILIMYLNPNNSNLILSFFSAVLIVGAVSFKNTKTKFDNVFNYLGDSSYSLYLFHIPALNAYILVFKKLNIFNLTGNLLGQVLIVILTFVSCCVFYSIIEKPVQGYLRKKIIYRNKINETIQTRAV